MYKADNSDFPVPYISARSSMEVNKDVIEDSP